MHVGFGLFGSLNRAVPGTLLSRSAEAPKRRSAEAMSASGGRAHSDAPQPSPSSRAGNAPGGRPPRPSPLLRARHFPARFGGSLAAALLAALMFLLAGAPAHAQTVAWNATLTSADNWALGSTYTYDGYGSSAADYLTTTHGSLSPGSFTVGGTTHTVELLGVRGGTDNRLYLLTDTGVTKSDLAGHSLEITVGGSTTTLKVKDATDESSLGFYRAASRHSFGPDDWQANTITVTVRPNHPPPRCPQELHHVAGQRSRFVELVSAFQRRRQSDREVPGALQARIDVLDQLVRRESGRRLQLRPKPDDPRPGERDGLQLRGPGREPRPRQPPVPLRPQDDGRGDAGRHGGPPPHLHGGRPRRLPERITTTLIVASETIEGSLLHVCQNGRDLLCRRRDDPRERGRGDAPVKGVAADRR